MTVMQAERSLLVKTMTEHSGSRARCETSLLVKTMTGHSGSHARCETSLLVKTMTRHSDSHARCETSLLITHGPSILSAFSSSSYSLPLVVDVFSSFFFFSFSKYGFLWLYCSLPLGLF